jgi:hypothetical protein
MNDILNWLYSNVPSFMRPGLGWLLEGLRRIISWVSSFWNWLGVSVSRWVSRVMYWRDRILNYAASVVNAIVWLRTVFIPRLISETIYMLSNAINAVIHWLLTVINDGLASVRWLVGVWVEFLSGIIATLGEYARYWIERITAWADRLIAALAHVLHGPDVLAEWLVAALWRRALQFLYTQRDRLAQWLLRESVTATHWLATELESVIMRWL